MFTVHQVNNGYIVRDEFGAKVGWFQEKYYADLFCSLVNDTAQQGVQRTGLTVRKIQRLVGTPRR